MDAVPPDLSDMMTWMLGGPPPMKIHSSTFVISDEPPLLEDYVLGGPPPSEVQEFAEFQSGDVQIDDVKTLPAWIACCGHFATLSSVLVNLSLIPIILKIKREKSVGSMPLLPFSIMAVSSFAWLLYGFLISSPKVWITNATAVPLSAILFMQYCKYSPQESPTLPGKLIHHVNGVSVLFIATIASIFLFPLRTASQLVGFEALTLFLFRDSSALLVLPEILRTKCVESIPIPFTIACAFNSALWIVYGKLEMDNIVVYAPYAIRFLSNALQLFVILIFGHRQKKYDKTLPMNRSL